MEAGDGQSDRLEIRRFVPDEPFPTYSYVTGRFPHPTRDRAGHSFGVVPVPCSAPDPDRWRDCRPYLYGLDLFNHGYYWEAHEVWEGLWHASGRGGPAGNFIKGLIKLAAAGVKAREGRPEGVRTHAQRAAELFRQVAAQLPSRQTCYFGLSLQRLVDLATEVARGRVASSGPTEAPVEAVFQFVLYPEESLLARPATRPSAP
ncbi:MAG: DUF309 domain-containing protein [Planctomycetia bacterium]|nr:DUF309 domain-containing protein [Planctomycetia bacterium]